MKKKLLVAIGCISAFAIGVVVYRLGDRSLTILRNDVPAAGETIERMGPHGMETMTLDDQGRLDLPWGLSEPHPQFFFGAAKDRNYQMKLPALGQRIYNVWDRGLTRIDIVFEFGPLSWTKRISQE